ncbi:hypothetical protein [Streptomyces fractus]|uniref:hypothetical protein n=1 Tax=Streptomyces fractus TaxID=641806 RepID=UPI003CEA0EA4
MDGPLFTLCTLLTALATIVSLRHSAQRNHRPQYRIARAARTTAAAVCCAGSALSIPAVTEYATRTTGISGIAQFAAHLAAIGFCACLQVMLADWYHPAGRLRHSANWRLWAMLATVTVLTVQFWLIDSERTTPTTDFADNIQVYAYLLNYLGFAVYAATDITWQATRLACAASRKRLAPALGLWLTAGGGLAFLLYALTKSSYLLAFQLGHAWPLKVEQVLSSQLIGLCVVTVAAGMGLAMFRNGTTAPPQRSTRGDPNAPQITTPAQQPGPSDATPG